MDGHFAVLDGERTFAVACLVCVEHGAVGVKIGGIDAVCKRGLFGNRFFFGGRLLRSRFFGSGLLCLRGLGISGRGFCRSAGAAGQNGGKQQSGKRQCKKFFHFGVLLSVRCSGAENFCPGAWVCDLY